MILGYLINPFLVPDNSMKLHRIHDLQISSTGYLIYILKILTMFPNYGKAYCTVQIASIANSGGFPKLMKDTHPLTVVSEMTQCHGVLWPSHPNSTTKTTW